MDTVGTAVMEKPKRGPKPKATVLPQKTIAFRVSGEYGQWLERLAEHNRTTVAGLMDQAIAAYGKQIEFSESPPKR